MRRSYAAAALVIACSLVLAGCAASAPSGQPGATISTKDTARTQTPSPSPTSARDAEALAQLSTVAATSADVDGTVSRVDCWLPSEHMVGGTAPAGVFSVICRVHYLQKDAKRYKDMRCIGDFEKTPMLTTCYRWAYHSLQPRFEDGPALATPSPTPAPTP